MLTLVPAYGRDYKSLAAVKADFEANKDFSDALSGLKVNKEDLLNSGDKRVKVRYQRLTKVQIIEVAADAGNS